MNNREDLKRSPASRTEMIGFAGLCLFSFGLFFKPTQAYQGLALMALAAVPEGRMRRLIRDPLFLLSLLFLSYLAIRTAHAWLEFPGLHREILDAARRWARTGFLAVFIVAFWYARRPATAPRLLLLALAGLLGRILFRFDWQETGNVLQAFLIRGERATFGFSANNLGTWCAVATLGLAIYIRPFCGPARRKALFGFRAFLWLMALSVTFGCLFFSQARASWIAFATVLPFALLFQNTITRHRKRQWVLALAIIGVLTTTLGLLDGHELLERRLLDDRAVISQVMEGEIDKVPPTSLGQRIGLYELFFERFRERPLAGWGPGLARELISEAKMDALVQNGYIHFHNVVFDILIQLGLTGGALFGAMAWLLVLSLWRGYRQGAMSNELFTLVIGGATVFMISGLASEPMFNSTGSFFMAFAGGLAYAFRLRNMEDGKGLLNTSQAAQDVQESP